MPKKREKRGRKNVYTSRDREHSHRENKRGNKRVSLPCYGKGGHKPDHTQISKNKQVNTSVLLRDSDKATTETSAL